MNRIIDQLAGHQRRRFERGTTILEFTIVASLLFSMLFGIIEFGLAFRDRLTISNATQNAARVGAARGDDADADFEILKAMESSLSNLPNTGIQIVKFVDVFRATTAGLPASGCPGAACNRYTYTPGGPGCDWNPCPDPDAGYSGWPWNPSSRDVALPDLEVLGVRTTFSHNWITGGLIPLPNVDCTGAPGTSCWVDIALFRQEPQVFEP
ncbi:MAG TPA: TadE/TadG family type IV pilus assembly protein [Acidimicrobiia bacterium]|jgi:hypothetical protein